MFEHWRQYAQASAGQFGVTSNVALRAHDLVCSVLGNAWIEEQERRVALPTRTVADIHPLFFSMRGRTERCLVEVCELAGLLLHFKDDPRFVGMFASLRDAKKYHATTMELDLAWKFGGTGAPVALAPPTPHGIADFSVTIGNKVHIVEVSGFPADPFTSELMAFHGAVANAMRSADRQCAPSGPIALEVIISDPPAGKSVDLRRLRGDLHAAVVHAVREYTSRSRPVVHSRAFGTVGVRLACAHEQPDLELWSMASCLTEVPRSLSNQIGTVDYKTGRDTHWMYLRIPDDIFDPYERIEKKLKIESRQLRGCADGVLVIPINGLGRGGLDIAEAALTAVVDRFRRVHRSTTGIALPTRHHKTDGTTGINGPYFSLAETSLPAEFWDKICEIDDTRSILGELAVLR